MDLPRSWLQLQRTVKVSVGSIITKVLARNRSERNSRICDDLARAIELWKRKVDINVEDHFSDEFVDVTRPGFGAAEHEDRTIIPETEFGLFLPEWDNVTIISCRGFIELTKEMEQAFLIEG
jgi:hypothetical protein